MRKASVFEALAQEASPQGRRRLAGRSRVRDSQESKRERRSIGESYGQNEIPVQVYYKEILNKKIREACRG